MKFLFFFVVMPVVELWFLIKVGEKIGALHTIGLLFLSAMMGVALLKRQGISTLMKMNQKMAAGKSPAREAVEGILLALGGVLFLLPGFISDAFGLLCVFPPARRLLAHYWLKRMGGEGFVHVHVKRQGEEQESNIYEAEFQEVTPEDRRLP